MQGGSPASATVRRDGDDASFPKEKVVQMAGDGDDGILHMHRAGSPSANRRPAVTRGLTEPSLKVPGPADNKNW
jgi:hypothetical protein